MRTLVIVLGLALGVLAGFGLVLANPLALFDRPANLPAGSLVSKSFRTGEPPDLEDQVLQLLGLRVQEGFQRDPANRNVHIGVVLLPAGDGTPAALAVRVTAVAEQNSLWRARLGTLEYWTVAWPGEGSLFLTGFSNYWGLTRDLGWGMVRGRQRAALAAAYPLTGKPPPGQAGGILGGSGRYAGVGGDWRLSVMPEPSAGANWTLEAAVTRPGRAP